MMLPNRIHGCPVVEAAREPYRRHPAVKYTSEDDARVAALRAQRPPWTWNDIATVLGRPSGQGVRSRFEKVRRAAEARAKVRPKTMTRPCMTCRRPMKSRGPGHRRCDYCRANVHETPFDCGGGVSVRETIRIAERGQHK